MDKGTYKIGSVYCHSMYSDLLVKIIHVKESGLSDAVVINHPFSFERDRHIYSGWFTGDIRTDHEFIGWHLVKSIKKSHLPEWW